MKLFIGIWISIAVLLLMVLGSMLLMKWFVEQDYSPWIHGVALITLFALVGTVWIKVQEIED